MKNVTGFLSVVLTIMFAGNVAFGMSVMNIIPAATGTVVDEKNCPVEGVTVTVTFIGTNSSSSAIGYIPYKIKQMKVVTDTDGRYCLAKTTVNLLNPKGKFWRAEVIFEKEGFLSRKIEITNERVFGGAVGAYVIGFYEALHSMDLGHTPFGPFSYAYKVMKKSKFSKVYKSVIESKPVIFNRSDGDVLKHKQFDTIYGE